LSANERPGRALVDRRPPAVSGLATSVPTSRLRSSGRLSLRVSGARLPSFAGLQRVRPTASGLRPNQPDPWPAERPPPRCRVRPGPIPTQARASSTAATRITIRWRRSGGFIEDTILAPATARHTGRQKAFLLGLGPFWIEGATSGSRRDHVGSDATEGGAAQADVVAHKLASLSKVTKAGFLRRGWMFADHNATCFIFLRSYYLTKHIFLR
jgi:hypothetical protein